MPARLFTFSGAPVFGEPFVSNWLDISSLRSADLQKQIVLTTPGGGNPNISTQVQLSGDDADAATPAEYDFEAPQKGNKWNLVKDFAANLVRIIITGLPASPDTSLKAWVGIEYETDAEATQNGAFLNNDVVSVGPASVLTNRDSGGIAQMSGTDASLTLPDLATAADGETHWLKRYDLASPGGALTLLAHAGQSILDNVSGVSLPSDGDSVFVTKLSSTQWIITVLNLHVSANQVLPIAAAAVTTAGLTPIVGRSVRNVGAQSKTITIPTGAPSAGPTTFDLVEVVVVKEVGNGGAGDTVQLFKGATPLTDAMDIGVNNKVVVRAGSIDSGVALAAGDVITVTTVQAGTNASCRTSVQLFRTS